MSEEIKKEQAEASAPETEAAPKKEKKPKKNAEVEKLKAELAALKQQIQQEQMKEGNNDEKDV